MSAFKKKLKDNWFASILHDFIYKCTEPVQSYY